MIARNCLAFVANRINDICLSRRIQVASNFHFRAEVSSLEELLLTLTEQDGGAAGARLFLSHPRGLSSGKTKVAIVSCVNGPQNNIKISSRLKT
jgi:hypothetical protein